MTRRVRKNFFKEAAKGDAPIKRAAGFELNSRYMASALTMSIACELGPKSDGLPIQRPNSVE